ncbi:MAG: dTDP-4-dehydrorhamnose 3,5-epimerase family protein [Pseudoruegeria sp.]
MSPSDSLDQKWIEGVRVTDLKLMPNEFGRLMEVQRRDEPNFPGFGQAYITQSFAGVVKAWYRHSRQTDQIAVVSGLVKLVLFDDRKDSSTEGQVDKIIMGELAPKLVLIPPKVWHGFQAIGDTSAFLLHLNSEPFDFADPDEERRNQNDALMPDEWS